MFGKNLVRNLESYCEDDPMATSPLLIYDGEEMRDFGEHKVSIRNWRDGFCLDKIHYPKTAVEV